MEFWLIWHKHHEIQTFYLWGKNMTFKGVDQGKGSRHFKELINDSSVDEIIKICIGQKH